MQIVWPNEENVSLHIVYESESIGFALEEILDRKAHTPTEQETARHKRDYWWSPPKTVPQLRFESAKLGAKRGDESARKTLPLNAIRGIWRRGGIRTPVRMFIPQNGLANSRFHTLLFGINRLRSYTMPHFCARAAVREHSCNYCATNFRRNYRVFSAI